MNAEDYPGAYDNDRPWDISRGVEVEVPTATACTQCNRMLIAAGAVHAIKHWGCGTLAMVESAQAAACMRVVIILDRLTCRDRRTRAPLGRDPKASRLPRKLAPAGRMRRQRTLFP